MPFFCATLVVFLVAAIASAQGLKLAHVRQRALVNRMSTTVVPGITLLDRGPANFIAFLDREPVKRRLAFLWRYVSSPLYDPLALVSETCGSVSVGHLRGPANFSFSWAQAWRILLPLF